MITIKRIISVIIALAFICSAGLAETVYGVYGEPYYHLDSSCEFGVYTRSGVLVSGSVPKAESAGLRACPSCASDLEPYFTADFPAWENDIKPWSTGVSYYVSSRLINSWGGDVSERINSLCKLSYYGILCTTKYPEDYAGVFKNASGCYTILMVNPTDERVEKYRKTLGCEFWVLNAKYSMNELTELDNSVLLIWNADENDALKINACGIDSAANRVSIGTSDVSAKNKNNIIKCIEALGYTGDMVLIYESNRDTWY